MQLTGQILTNASATDRNSTDFYPTPPAVTIALIEFLGLKGKTIWEPACGAGHMADAILETGNNVIATELNYQGYGTPDVDFLKAPLVECDWIITNPPFKYAEQFIDRCIEHKKPFAMLLKSQYWHSAKRYKLFQKHIPSFVLPLTWRPDFHFGSKGGSPTMECIWTVWDAKPATNTTYMPLVKPTVKPTVSKKNKQTNLNKFFEVVTGENNAN